MCSEEMGTQQVCRQLRRGQEAWKEPLPLDRLREFYRLSQDDSQFSYLLLDSDLIRSEHKSNLTGLNN